MILIIEGLDGVGKTTIAKMISDKYDFQYIHESYTDDVNEKQSRILDMLERLLSGKNYIYDRTTLIDDFVYSFLNNTPSTLTNYIDLIIPILKKCKIIHLELDEEERRKRFDQRGDEFITNDQIMLIDQQYNMFYAVLPNVQYVDLVDDNEENIEMIMRRIKE